MPTTRRRTRYSNLAPKERLPRWVKPSIGRASQLEKIQKLVKENNLHTICEEGRCPNRGECYASGTATFLLGGSVCTRSCAFCQVDKGKPSPHLDVDEALRVANAVNQMGLRYVVITSVARDDLHDHGVSLFTNAMREIRKLNPSIEIEVLTPDFYGHNANTQLAIKLQRSRVTEILKAKPVCFNHNLETVERLQKEVRRGATYNRSLGLLKIASHIAPSIPTKSGLMLGLGEKKDEIIQTLRDLREVNCSRITIGQYLRPSLSHIPVQHYWEPIDFVEFGEIAKSLGFKKVNSGPLVRSSYHAKED
tara:strand:- start:620 stop:1540 length:921 start_codon:yes stop_codon:yes gene_type:complete